MKRIVILGATAFAVLTMSGCGLNSASPRNTPTTQSSVVTSDTVSTLDLNAGPLNSGNQRGTRTTEGTGDLSSDAQVTQLENDLDSIQANLDQVDQLSSGN